MEFKVLNYNIDSQEADIMFIVDNNSFICYAHPLRDVQNLKKNKLSFFTFMADNICRADSSFCIEKTDVSYYSYKIQGKFIGNKIVKIGEINIFVDGYIPADIQIDEFISFYCMRIDLMVNSL